MERSNRVLVLLTPYSTKLVEGFFPELRLYGVLRNSPVFGLALMGSHFLFYGYPDGCVAQAQLPL